MTAEPLSSVNANATSDTSFQRMIQLVADYGIFMLDVDSRVATWNLGAERMTQYRTEEIVGQPFGRLYGADDSREEDEIRQALAQGAFETEGWLVRKDGTRFWASRVFTAIRDDHRLLGVSVVLRDLTKRRLNEEKLRDSEHRLRTMIESVTDYAIFLLDPEGRVVTWNSGAQRLKGYSTEEIVGSHFSRFYTQKDVREGRPGWLMETARRDGRVADEGWRVRKDGSRFWALAVLTALHDKKGNLIGFTKVTRDLTERKEMEDALRDAKVSLEEKVAERTAQLLESNHELEQFTFIASHDLQEPIRKILMYGDRLRAEEGFRPRQAELLEKVLNAAYRLRAIVQDLLQFSRLTQTPPARDVFNLRDVVDEALADLELQISESHATVEIGDLPEIQANRSQIRHVFQNLLSNAVKFRRPDVPPRIEITAARPYHGRVRVCVADNGIGFDEQYKSKIFLPFQRLHQRSQYAGTGMGLSIVQKIVRQHGGMVDVTSSPGRGTTFFVELPLAPEPAKVASRG